MNDSLMESHFVKQLQVNIPYRMFKEGYLDKFVEYGLNPEIGFDAGALDTVSIPEANAIAEQFHGAGRTITLHGPFIDLAPGSPDPHIRKITHMRFDQLTSLVPIFKPKTVVCHTGYDHKRYWAMGEAWIENSLRIWEPMAATLKREGTRLMLENVYEKTPLEILPLMEHLKPHGVGFCLDIGHQAVFGTVMLEQWMQSMSGHLQQLHLHDNNGAQDDHWALGLGNIDIQGLFNDLVSRKIHPLAVTLEPHKEEDLKPSLEYLDPIWPW
jgi:sugar phosphate isomerase/epimerase